MAGQGTGDGRKTDSENGGDGVDNQALSQLLWRLAGETKDARKEQDIGISKLPLSRT